MNPINVTLNIHSKSPAFQAKQWKIPISNFLVMLTPNNLHGSEHLSGHTSDAAVKQHLASRLTTNFFWNSIDNHNRSCKRWSYVIMPEWKVFAKPKKNDKLILDSGYLFVTEAKTKMNEWLQKKKSCLGASPVVFAPPPLHGIFWEGKSCWFWPEKTFEFVISARKSLWISAKTFFFLEITCFSLKLRLNPIQEQWKSFAPMILILLPWF